MAVKLKQESFKVEEKNTLELVRDDRFSPPDGLIVKIEGNDYDAYNYSSFGLKVVGPRALKSGLECEGEVFLHEKPISTHRFRCVWAANENHENTATFGLETIGAPLDMNKIKGIFEAQNVVASFREPDPLDKEFKHLIYEVREALENLEKKVLLVEQSQQNLISKNELSEFEDAFADEVSDFLRVVMRPKFDQLSAFLKKKSEDEVKIFMEFFRNALSSMLYQSPFSSRALEKPLGYAGDYQMMNYLYRNEVHGTSLFSKCLHLYYMKHPNAKAVRNRKEYLYEKIKQTLQKADGPIKILSVACGPAEEVQTIISQHPEIDLSKIQFDLLDQDVTALKHAKKGIKIACRETERSVNVNFVNKAIKNIIVDGVHDKYDLIYSAGLFDYFSDMVALTTAMHLYEALSPGGKCVIGNFRMNAADKALMDYVLDWKLIYRSEEELKALYGKVTPHVTVESEKESINLFANLEKKG